jgi:hypothetical protein
MMFMPISIKFRQFVQEGMDRRMGKKKKKGKDIPVTGRGGS